MLSEVANHKTYESVLERLNTSLNTIFCLINRILQKIFTRMRQFGKTWVRLPARPQRKASPSEFLSSHILIKN